MTSFRDKTLAHTGTKARRATHRRYDDRRDRPDLRALAVCNNLNGPICDEVYLTSDDAEVTCGRCIRIREIVPNPDRAVPFSPSELRKLSRTAGSGPTGGTPEGRAAWYVANWSLETIAKALVTLEDAFAARPAKHFAKRRKAS